MAGGGPPSSQLCSWANNMLPRLLLLVSVQQPSFSGIQLGEFFDYFHDQNKKPTLGLVVLPFFVLLRVLRPAPCVLSAVEATWSLIRIVDDMNHILRPKLSLVGRPGGPQISTFWTMIPCSGPAGAQ